MDAPNAPPPDGNDNDDDDLLLLDEDGMEEVVIDTDMGEAMDDSSSDDGSDSGAMDLATLGVALPPAPGGGGAAAAPPAAPSVEDMSAATFSGHVGNPVYCVAAHPTEPSCFLTGGGDDRAYLWRCAAGSAAPAAAVELAGHGDSVSAVAFSFDGVLCATGGYDGLVKVWDGKTGALKRTLDGPGEVEWLAWHSKGHVLLAGSQDGTVWMWLATNGSCMQVFAGHEDSVTCGLFTPDGRNVATGSSDGTVRVWAPKKGTCKHTFQGHGFHDGPVTCLAASPDGTTLLSGSVDGTAKLVHLESKRVVASFVHAAPVSAGGPGGAAPAVTGDGSGAQEEVTAVECVGYAAAAVQQPWVATGGIDGTLQVWDTVTGRRRLGMKHGGAVVRLLWHHTHAHVYTCAADHSVRLWNARDGALLRRLTGHTDMVLDLALAAAPAGGEAGAPDVLVSGSDDGSAKCWRVAVAALA